MSGRYKYRVNYGKGESCVRKFGRRCCLRSLAELPLVAAVVMLSCFSAAAAAAAETGAGRAGRAGRARWGVAPGAVGTRPDGIVAKPTAEDDEDLWVSAGNWKNAPDAVAPTPHRQMLKAMHLESLGDARQAAEQYRRLAERYPEAEEATEALIRSARNYLAAGDFTNCRKQLNELRRRWRSIPPAYLDALGKAEIDLAYGFLDGRGEGGTYRLGSRVRKARRIFQRLLKDDPQGRWADDAQLGLGRCTQLLGKWDDAIKEYKTLLKKYPRTSLRTEAEGYIAECISRREPRPLYAETETAAALRRIREVKREAADPRRRLSADEEAEDPDVVALNEYEKILSERQAEKRFQLARFYAVNNRFRAAEIYFERIKRLYPKSKWAARADKELKKLKRY